MRVALLALAGLLLLPAAEAATVTVHAGTAPDGSLYFRPRDVKVQEGEKVTIVLVNDDPRTPHDWAILEYGDRDIEAYVKGGETKTITFTADEAGTFRILCQVVGHKQQGMEGRFVVEDRLFVPAPPLVGPLAAAAVALALRRILAA